MIYLLAKYPNKRNVIEFVSLEAMVPKDHLLRKIDAAIDFDRIYDFVQDLYCEDNGRPGIDPVILTKRKERRSFMARVCL